MARAVFSVSLTPVTSLEEIVEEHPKLEAHAGLYYMVIMCRVL
jgi:hypothetical protein